MKRLLYLILILLSFNSYSQSAIDSLSSIDQFGRVRDGIIAQNIIDVLNTDPSGIKLTENEKQYIRTIVNGLYTTGVWEKCKAVYGFVGGNEWKHKWNWKDMRDLDGAFRLVYSGGITHSSTGMVGNGTTGSANTFILPQSVLSPTSSHLSFYSGTESTQTTNPIEIGTREIGLSRGYSLSIGTGSPQITINSTTLNSSTYPSQNVNTTLGFFITTRTGTTLTTYSDRNNFVNIRTGLNNSLNLTYGNIRILSYTNASDAPERFSNRQCRFATVGDGLTDTESIRMIKIITFAQSILNRQ